MTDKSAQKIAGAVIVLAAAIGLQPVAGYLARDMYVSVAMCFGAGMVALCGLVYCFSARGYHVRTDARRRRL